MERQYYIPLALSFRESPCQMKLCTRQANSNCCIHVAIANQDIIIEEIKLTKVRNMHTILHTTILLIMQ